MKKLFFLSVLASAALGLHAFAPISIIPAPREMKLTGGESVFNGKINCETVASIPEEGYELSITKEKGVTVRASTEKGRFYARTTLLHIACRYEKADGKKYYPCLEIKDAPKYKWRGVQLDDARHHFGKETVKRLLEQMSWYKYNVFHWHLTEDQCWTLDIPGYPELNKWSMTRDRMPAHGARRDETVADGQYGPCRYTAADLKEIVAFAAKRHITVVPEIEVPGHTMAALCAYPQFACNPDEILNKWHRKPPIWCAGVYKDVLCVGNPEAIQFFEKVFDYVCDIFPSKVIHIGGDECPSVSWKTCPKCQALMKREGIPSEKELQAWVTRHFTEYLAKKGRRVIGWDEIFKGGEVPKTTIGMYWRAGSPEGLKAVNKGYDIVACPTSHCYFDYKQGLPEDPFQYIGGNLPITRVYQFDPLKGVAPEHQCHVLGGECENWSSHTWNRFDLEWKLWPRGMALAEALWTAPEKRDFAEFSARAEEHRRRLIKVKINCAPLK